MSSVRMLLAAVVLAVGVSVAVQVMPPSPVVKFDNAPLDTDTSAVVKPETASVKTKVVVAVSPIFKAVSEMVIDEASVGRSVSIA